LWWEKIEQKMVLVVDDFVEELFVRSGWVCTTLHYRRKHFIPLLTKLRITDAPYVAHIISIFINSLIIYFMLLHMFVRIQ